MESIVIVSAARTAIGSYLGGLSSLSAPALGSYAIKEAKKRAGVENVSEVLMGNVLQAGIGQAPCRQAALGAGLDVSVPCATLHKVCGSGLYAIINGAQNLMLGCGDVVIAGGMESMSSVPHLMPGARTGLRLGHGQILDSLLHDGLWDPYNDMHMGSCGEILAKEWKISREDQDTYAIESFQRAEKAQDLHQKDIVPITIKGKKRDTVVDNDEGPQNVRYDKIPTLKAAFEKDGTITAANASSINDGAAAVVLMREKEAISKGKKPLAKIVAYAGHAAKPEWFTTAPIFSTKKVLEKAGWARSDVDVFEINEAFAVVTLAASRELAIPREKLNPLGGAIALGHPVGASGTRIVITLLRALQEFGGKKGVASICLGGGEALSLALELL